MSDSTIHQAYGQPLPEGPGTQPQGEAKNDGLAVCALLFGWTLWPAGLIFGHASNHAAKRSNRRRSVLSIIGLIGAYFWLTVSVGLILGVLFSSSPPATHTVPSPAPATSASQSPNPVATVPH